MPYPLGYRDLEIKQLNFINNEAIKFACRVINIQRCDVNNDVITFEHDSRNFTDVRKLMIVTGSLNLSSHEQIERLFR